jgi:hypothetical protein
MDRKKLTLRQAAELVWQSERDGIDCANCNKTLSLADWRCPNCGHVLSKVPVFAIIAILAGVAVAALLVVDILGLF